MDDESRLTTERLDALDAMAREAMAREAKERADKATAGPWRFAVLGPRDSDSMCLVMHGPREGWIGHIGSGCADDPRHKANAEHIAHAREDVPALAAALLEATAEVRRLRAEVWRLHEEATRPAPRSPEEQEAMDVIRRAAGNYSGIPNSSTHGDARAVRVARLCAIAESLAAALESGEVRLSDLEQRTVARLRAAIPPKGAAQDGSSVAQGGPNAGAGALGVEVGGPDTFAAAVLERQHDGELRPLATFEGADAEQKAQAFVATLPAEEPTR